MMADPLIRDDEGRPVRTGPGRHLDPLPEGGPRGLAGARLQRWLQGHDYSERPRPAEPPPPHPKPAPRVTVRVPDRYRQGRRDAPTSHGGYDQLAARLRAAGVDATSTGRSLRIPNGQQAEAARLLRRWSDSTDTT